VFISEPVDEKKLKSVNISQSYKQVRGCLVHFVRLANTSLKDEECARDNHLLACKLTDLKDVITRSVYTEEPWANRMPATGV